MCMCVFVCTRVRLCVSLTVCKGVVSTWCASLMCETSAMTVEPSVPKGETECKSLCVCACMRARVRARTCVSSLKHECDCVFLQNASTCLFVCPCAFREQLCMNFLHQLSCVCVCVCGVVVLVTVVSGLGEFLGLQC